MHLRCTKRKAASIHCTDECTMYLRCAGGGGDAGSSLGRTVIALEAVPHFARRSRPSRVSVYGHTGALRANKQGTSGPARRQAARDEDAASVRAHRYAASKRCGIEWGGPGLRARRVRGVPVAPLPDQPQHRRAPVPGRGVVVNKHSTDVESPHPHHHPHVCTRMIIHPEGKPRCYAVFQGTSNGGRQFLRNRRSNRHIVPLYGNSDRLFTKGRKFAHR